MKTPDSSGLSINTDVKLFTLDIPKVGATSRTRMPKNSRGGCRGGKAKAETTPKTKKAKRSFVWKSAPEILAELLPKLTAVVGSIRGRGKDAIWRKLYLHTLHECPNVTIAARIAGVTRQSVAKARDDAEFAAAEKEAIGAGIDLVEAAAFKSAVYGDLEPVYWQGLLVGHTVKYSDAMRALLLRAHKPEKYREKVDIEHTGAVKHTHLTLDEFEKRYGDANK